MECEKLGSMMQLSHNQVTRYPQTTKHGFLELNQQSEEGVWETPLTRVVEVF